jgi:hypothetical protein
MLQIHLIIRLGTSKAAIDNIVSFILFVLLGMKNILSLLFEVTMRWKLKFRRTDCNIVLENNIPQKEGETHYKPAHDFVFWCG